MPFYFVQLANFGDEAEFADRGWARLREAQEQALALPNTGMAVAIDIGEAHNIHPRNKQEVGRRLALIARARVYGLPPEVSGPVFAGAVREGSAMSVRFTHAGDELQARGGEVRRPSSWPAPTRCFIRQRALSRRTRFSCPPRMLPNPSRCATLGRTPRGKPLRRHRAPAVPFRSDDW